MLLPIRHDLLQLQQRQNREQAKNTEPNSFASYSMITERALQTQDFRDVSAFERMMQTNCGWNGVSIENACVEWKENGARLFGV